MSRRNEFETGVRDPATGQLGRGDRGRLPEQTRRALVHLLRGPYLSQALHPKAWAALVRDEQQVRESLANLFLELTIDTELAVAFVQNADFDGVEVPRVMRSTPLTLLDTALVLHLRQVLLRGADASGRVFIGRDEVNDALAVYRSATNTDPATFARRINSAVEKMRKNQVLLSTPEPDRFEISPILAVVFDATEVAAVAAEVRSLREEEAADTDSPDAPIGSGIPESHPLEPGTPVRRAAERGGRWRRFLPGGAGRTPADRDAEDRAAEELSA